MDWDLFISHAFEDKDAIARPLAKRFEKKKFRVWYDEFSLDMGDSLRESINKGLAGSRFGLVILSPRFFAKKWTNEELNGLVAAGKRILPVWHEVGFEDVARFCPTLADKKAEYSSNGQASIVKAAMRAMGLPQADISAEAKGLIEKIQAGGVPLSQHVMEVLNFARRLGDESLERFCRNELNGWFDTDDEAELAHRILNAHATFHQINPLYVGWSGGMNNAIAFMNANPSWFSKVKWVDRNPVTSVESRQDGPPTSLAMWESKYSQTNPGCRPEQAEQPVYIYGSHDANSRTLRHIKEALLARIARLL